MSAEVGAALGDADIDDLYATIVEDPALRFSIVDPKGGARSLTVPIPVISFNAGDYTDYLLPSLQLGPRRKSLIAS
ncbi:hypothetical protein [Microvirga zambiensis]|uniref:hypothetical protein n=1 Tax=Microvirga zambiensis TaxID=1402137 RepID=UPI00191D33CB|nr:hypothetical protein [Microvirga zambiensis]